MPDLAQRLAPLDPAGADRLSGWLRGYRTIVGIPDELFDASGRPREHWLRFLSDLADYPADQLKNRFSLATRHIRDTGVTYRVYGEENERTWPINPVPLILGQGEWAVIEAAVRQRARLMEAILRDIYGEAALVAQGDLPAAALTGSPDFVRALRGVPPPGGRYLQLYAADLARGPDGRWWVLGDRTQAPSGAGYELENRLVLSRAYPNLYNAMNVERLAPFFDALRKGLASAAERVDPRICLLTPGPFSETYFEQAHLARYLGFLLVEGDDLVVNDGLVYVRTIAGLKRADVLWRRVDADFVDPLELNAASRLGVPGLLEAMRAGRVAVLNMPGSGVVESPALLGFLPRLCRRLLGEELRIPHVATWWCGQEAERTRVRGSNDLLIAPAFNVRPQAYGGERDPFARPRLMAELDAAGRDEFESRLEARPGDFVGQEVVRLSTMPVLRDDRLEPAPFVLRVYAAATPEGFEVMPGGFCRTSDQLDVRAISMGEGARTADVWVIGEAPVERVSLLASRDDTKVRRILGHLPSRAADNLFWLGRYLERAEATLRLVRSLCTSLMDAEAAVHGAGETLTKLQELLIAWEALDEDFPVGARALDAARPALLDAEAFGAVVTLVRRARRTAASLRERLSADFWTLLLNLESGLTDRNVRLNSEADALQLVETALRILAALAGLAQENMNRAAGWRFMDIGRRIERGINTCRFTRTLAHDEATPDDLDLLLDLVDSQITYRARYLVGLALTPVRDMVVLDPFNTRSVAFQVDALEAHFDALPALVEDGMMEAHTRVLRGLATEVETAVAADVDPELAWRFQDALMTLSNAVSDRYFLRGANAKPTIKLAGLA
jgi:uncharacterized circularly permuted ATP-grasp superfamily protein/uncharacterized alpha-E superfamily protein